jgi:hypothetical protein
MIKGTDARGEREKGAPTGGGGDETIGTSFPSSGSNNTMIVHRAVRFIEASLLAVAAVVAREKKKNKVCYWRKIEQRRMVVGEMNWQLGGGMTYLSLSLELSLSLSLSFSLSLFLSLSLSHCNLSLPLVYFFFRV